MTHEEALVDAFSAEAARGIGAAGGVSAFTKANEGGEILQGRSDVSSREPADMSRALSVEAVLGTNAERHAAARVSP